MQVKDSADALSVDLHSFCSDPNRPICMIRGLCSTLDININLFSSENLMLTCPDHHIEVRDQVRERGEWGDYVVINLTMHNADSTGS